MWLKCSLCSKNCSFPYSWLFSLSFRQLELFSISLEGSSYWKSTVILIITWKLLFFFDWICVIIWNICFWSVISSMYWKLRIGNCFYCNPTLAVLSTYTSDQNHKTMFFFHLWEKWSVQLKAIREFHAKIPYGINILVFVS